MQEEKYCSIRRGQEVTEARCGVGSSGGGGWDRQKTSAFILNGRGAMEAFEWRNYIFTNVLNGSNDNCNWKKKFLNRSYDCCVESRVGSGEQGKRRKTSWEAIAIQVRDDVTSTEGSRECSEK